MTKHATRLCAACSLLMVVGVLAGCGGTSTTGATATSAAAPLLGKKYVKAGTAADPDQDPEATTDASVTVDALGTDRYRLIILNTSQIGYLNTFAWSPPALMSIKSIGTVSSGTCHLADGSIACAANLKPPTCSCKADGGALSVDFTAVTKAPKNDSRVRGRGPVNYGLAYSAVRIYSATPVPYLIPSYPEAPKTEVDEAACKAGQKTTKTDPCTG